MSSNSLKPKLEKSKSGPSSVHISLDKNASSHHHSDQKLFHVNEKKHKASKVGRTKSDVPLQKREMTEVEQVEKKLLQLMEEFETGKLKAFGNESRLRQMEEIREKQENLAKLHFDCGADHDMYTPLSEEGLKASEENMTMLMKKLAELSDSIENLHTNTHTDKKSPLSTDSLPRQTQTTGFSFPTATDSPGVAPERPPRADKDRHLSSGNSASNRISSNSKANSKNNSLTDQDIANYEKEYNSGYSVKVAHSSQGSNIPVTYRNKPS